MNPLKWFSLTQWAFIGAFAALIGYHYYDRHAAVSEAKEALSNSFKAEKAQAILDAHAQWEKDSVKIDLMAELDRKNLKDRLDKIDNTLLTVKGGYHEVIIHDPLPAGCTASPGRVQSVNAALGH